MDTSFLLWLTLAIALLDWVAVYQKKRTLGYVTKPGTMLALLLWMLAQPLGDAGRLPWGLFAFGIFASLLGDIFLMLPNEKFIPGLLAFLVAHIFYIIGLNLTPAPFNPATILIVLMIAAIFGRASQRFRRALRDAEKTKLITPIIGYMLIISIMLFSALNTLNRPEWTAIPALILVAGALLFFISDLILGWNRFVTPIPRARLKVRMLYHLGQVGLIYGAWLQFR